VSTNPAQPENNGRQPLSPVVRRRLQECFKHGTGSAAKGDFDYATDMFTRCVLDDPANSIYIQQFLANLAKKYGDNKKGSKLAGVKGVTIKGYIKKAAYSKDWAALMKSGVEMLKLNPWDVSTLTAMASACEALQNDEAQLAYLKMATLVDPKDPEVNRLCGRALARMGQFDQAISCWARVSQAKPDDEEARRAVGELAIEKTISHGGYEGAETSTDVMADKAAKADRRSEATAKLTPDQALEKAIAKKPEDLANYIELADLHTREERHKQAEEVLNRALQVSGGDVAVRERLEDTQLRRGRQQIKIAELKAAKEKTPEAIELYNKMRAQFNSEEIDIFRSRGERYPTNLGYKFELALRLKKAGQYNEAIKCFQAASGDAKRKAATHSELGQCFQKIKQYKLAMSNYESALEAISPRDVDERKVALYRAGYLALALAEKYLANNEPQGKEDLDRADKYLNELAGLDFGYKDVPALLDKISKIRHKD
jgi:tetratricopeptide (TPR) repeat protein